MSLGIEVIASLAAGFAAAGVSAVFARLSALRRKRLEEQRNEYEQVYRKTISAFLEKYASLYKSRQAGESWIEILEESATASSSSPITSGRFMSKEEVKGEIDERIKTLNERIKDIEVRFPEQDTVEKIASVNEAILATQIENLAESIKNIEAKILTRWDVAKIVFQIIAVLSSLIGIIFAVIAFAAKSSGA